MLRIRLVVSTLAVVCLTALSASVAHGAPVPKKVAILIFDGVQMIDFSGPLEVFADAGYDVYTVAATLRPITTAAGPGLKVTPRYTFATAPQADLVVVPGGDFEAPPNSATIAWIKRQTAHAQHTLAVCNGAFTLANTGLLDGLEATTTAGNIARLRSTFPKIAVVDDRRVVDNGKLLTTGGLSAGIDGALRMVEIFDGHAAAQSVALFIEYDWQPNGGYVRAALADRVIPPLDTRAFGATARVDQKGDKDHWEMARRFTASVPAVDLVAAFAAAYAKGYAGVGAWAPNSFSIASSSATQADLRFDDRAGRHWRSLLTIEHDPDGAGRYVVRLVTDRLG